MSFSNPPGIDSMPVDVRQKLEEALEARARESESDYRTHHMTQRGLPKYVNRLILADSPYLRQHAHNPVNWFPWGEEAFEKAMREDKPVLLSVGYSTCHWCHVMERKSFEDINIAQYLNKNYVAIKVDREQNPAIDDTYMSAVRMISGRGGWPMTVWLTPSKQPFLGGTYFPPDRFLTVLRRVKQKYETSGDELETQAEQIADRIRQIMTVDTSGNFPEAQQVMDEAFEQMSGQFDFDNGGFGGEQKFPMPSRMQWLLRFSKRIGDDGLERFVKETLDAMANGGIYDHVGGGFHRYATDPEWLIPHFEKMLYDNAQLALTYTEAWQATKRDNYRRVVRETLDYLLRDMSNEDGALYAATDADSPPQEGEEHEEGAFFTWTPEQIRDALPPEQARAVIEYYDVTSTGNFEGANVFHVPRSRRAVAEQLGIEVSTLVERLKSARKTLYSVRDRRPSPDRDEHVITSWNGLALEAFARAALVFDEKRWLRAAKDIGDFIATKLTDDRGRLFRHYTYGAPNGQPYSEDYAFSIAGFLTLFEASGAPRWLEIARKLQGVHLQHYWDDRNGGFYQTSDEAEKVIARQKPDRDGATPSSNSVAALNLLRLYQFTLDDEYSSKAYELFEAFGDKLEKAAYSMAKMLVALDFFDTAPRQIALIEPDEADRNSLLPVYSRHFSPNSVLVRAEDSAVSDLAQVVPWLEDKTSVDGQPTAYVCRDFTCEAPTTDPEVFEDQMKGRFSGES